MRITPALIPHTDFHTGTWLRPVKRPQWYYFLDKKSSNAITNKNFLKSIDRPLRSLVKWLHQRGIKTTPSCSGHHISERNLEKIFSGLEKDKEEIRNGGLMFEDVETGRLYFLRDKNYKLPWNKQKFLNEVIEYQQTGVIGLRLGSNKKFRDKVKKVFEEPHLVSAGISMIEKDSVIFIFTNEVKSGNNKSSWKKITKILKQALS